MLLIDRDAVGFLEVLLHAGNVIFDGLYAVFAVDELWDVIHGARAIESIHGDEILKTGGMQLDEILLHTSRLELESASSSTLAIEFVGLWVIDRDFLDINVDAMVQFDICQCFLDNREVFQSQEVHLDQTRALDDTTLILGDDDALTIAVVCCAHRHPISNVVTTDDNTTSVYTRAAYTAFKFLSKADSLPHFGIVVI